MPERYGPYSVIEEYENGPVFRSLRIKSHGVEGFEKRLVVKELQPRYGEFQKARDYFVEQGRSAVRLRHRNLVSTFDVGTLAPEYPERVFVVQEHISGVCLADWLDALDAKGERFPLELALYLIAELARGLDSAHRLRDDNLRPDAATHRWLTAADVWLTRDGEVKLADFGLTSTALIRSASVDELPLAMARDIASLSPEQLCGKPFGPWSDIFGLGVLSYELLSGVSPFLEGSPAETAARVVEGGARPLQTVQALPEDIGLLIDGCLSASVENRPREAALIYEGISSSARRAGLRGGQFALAKFIRDSYDTSSAPPPLASALDRDASLRPSLPVNVPEVDLLGASGVVAGTHCDGALLAVTGCPGQDWDREAAGVLLERWGGIRIDVPSGALLGWFGTGAGGNAEAAVRAGLGLLRVLADGGSPSVGIDCGQLSISGGRPVSDAKLARLSESAEALAGRSESALMVSTAVAGPLRSFYDLSREGSEAPKSWRVGDPRCSSAESRFVGRRAEFKAISECLSRASRRKLQVVAVVAGVGMGKSRLLAEAGRRMKRAQLDVGYYVAGCAKLDQRPYAAIAAMLGQLCGMQPTDSLERVASVEPRLRTLGLESSQITTALDLLRGTADLTAVAVGAAFTEILRSLSKDRLHVLFWDDADELDRESLALLSVISGELSGSRLVLGFAAVTALATEMGALPILIPLLEPKFAEELCRARLGAAASAAPGVAVVMSAADGNPAHLEVASDLWLELRAGSASVTRPDILQGTVEELMLERLSRLGAAVSDLALAVAALGSPVDVAVAAQLLGVTVSELHQHGGALEAAGLARRNPPTSISLSSGLSRALRAAGSPRLTLLRDRSGEAHTVVYGRLSRFDRSQP